jgi:Cu/Zn superoxide dismutase
MKAVKTLLACTVLLSVAALVVAACGGSPGGGDERTTVPLAELVSSGQSGTATLTPQGDGATRVVVEVANSPDAPQPAHIHPGTCGDLDPLPAYPLTPVAGGSSETTVSVTLGDLRRGRFAVNVHLSEEEIRTSVACGDIR